MSWFRVEFVTNGRRNVSGACVRTVPSLTGLRLARNLQWKSVVASYKELVILGLRKGATVGD